jgi:hypothetical protein
LPRSARMSASTPISPAKADLPDRLSPSQPSGGIRRHGLGRTLPAPSIIPKLPRKVIEQGLLSTAQLETLVHALDATSQDLPGRYIVPRRALSFSRMPKARSTGAASLGDGTGAGKGRQLAAILMDHGEGPGAVSGSATAALILSRLCESVLARAPPVQWGGYSRRMDITRPITMLTRLKPGQHCDCRFRGPCRNCSSRISPP